MVILLYSDKLIITSLVLVINKQFRGLVKDRGILCKHSNNSSLNGRAGTEMCVLLAFMGRKWCNRDMGMDVNC